MNSNPWLSTSVRIALKGLSFIDAKRINIRNGEDAHEFLSCYGFDLDDPSDLIELEELRLEAIELIQEELLLPGEAIPPTLLEEKDIRQYLCYASGRGQIVLAQWSGAILRVIHTLTHSHSHFNDVYHQAIREQILDRFNAHINRQGNTCFLGNISLENIEFRVAKSRRSVAMKLMHKRENVTADIFDWIGIRFITKYRADVLDVLAYLREENIISYANLKPSKSRNTLINLDWVNKCYQNGMTTEEIRQKMQSMPYPSVDEQEVNNPFSEVSYHSVQITCRHRIKVEQANGKKMSFFFPFELQLMDRTSYQKTREGLASHSEYKNRQKNAVRKRVLPFLPALF